MCSPEDSAIFRLELEVERLKKINESYANEIIACHLAMSEAKSILRFKQRRAKDGKNRFRSNGFGDDGKKINVKEETCKK